MSGVAPVRPSRLMSRNIFFFKQKAAYELRISDWRSDGCSSDLSELDPPDRPFQRTARAGPGRHMVAVRRGFVRHRLLPCSRRRLYRDLIILRSSLHAQHQDTRDGPAPEGHFGTAVPRSLAPSARHTQRSEEHTSELQSLMRTSYASFFLKKKT